MHDTDTFGGAIFATETQDSTTKVAHERDPYGGAKMTGTDAEPTNGPEPTHTHSAILTQPPRHTTPTTYEDNGMNGGIKKSPQSHKTVVNTMNLVVTHH